MLGFFPDSMVNFASTTKWAVTAKWVLEVGNYIVPRRLERVKNIITIKSLMNIKAIYDTCEN